MVFTNIYSEKVSISKFVAARPAVPHAVHRRRGYQEQAKLHV